jgi:hypothetical protein
MAIKSASAASELKRRVILFSAELGIRSAKLRRARREWQS